MMPEKPQLWRPYTAEEIGKPQNVNAWRIKRGDRWITYDEYMGTQPAWRMTPSELAMVRASREPQSR